MLNIFTWITTLVTIGCFSTCTVLMYKDENVAFLKECKSRVAILDSNNLDLIEETNRLRKKINKLENKEELCEKQDQN